MKLTNNTADAALASLSIDGCTPEDHECHTPANLGDIQSSLASNTDAEIAVQEFLKLTRSRFGFGPAVNLLVDFVNISPN